MRDDLSGIKVCFNCANPVSEKAEKADVAPEDYRCPECGVNLPPLELPSKEEYQKFAKARRGRNEHGRSVMREGAEDFIGIAKRRFGLRLRYDLESVAMLDEAVEIYSRRRKKYDRLGTAEDWTIIMAAFLGEALRHVYGGKWYYDQVQGTWSLCLGKTKSGHMPTVWPLEQIEKRMTEGRRKSLAYYVKVLDRSIQEYGGPAEEVTPEGSEASGLKVRDWAPPGRSRAGKNGVLVAFAFFLAGTIIAIIDMGDPAVSYRDLVWTLFGLGFLSWLGASIYAHRALTKNR